MIECRLDWFGACHVDACDLEEIERVAAATGAEELQVFGAGCLGLVGLVEKLEGGAEAGRVLVDVEVVVEVGDSGPFESEFWVSGEAGAVVLLVEF